jgi:hypothetical protein
MKRYAFIILAALAFVGFAGTANAQVFSSSHTSVSGGPGGFRSNHQSVYVSGGRGHSRGGSVYVGGGRGGFDINIGTPNFQFHIGDRNRGYYRGYPNRPYYPPVYRQPRNYYDYGYGYRNYRPVPVAPTAVVYDRYGYPVTVVLHWDGYGYYYFLDGFRYRY